MKLEQDVCNGSKRKQIYKCDWLWQTGYYAKTKRKGERGMREGWEYQKLGELVKVINGLWVGKKPPFTNVAVVRNANFTKSCTLDMSNIAYIDVEEKQFNTRELQYADIIIEKSGGSEKQPVGRPVFFNIKERGYSFSNFTATLRVVSSDIVPEYLYKVLLAQYKQGVTKRLQSKTTGLHNLDFKSYLKSVIPIPSCEKQLSIVSELDKINELIRLKKEQLKDYDNLAQSIFYEMFGDPVVNEKGWEVKKLIETVVLECTISYGIVQPGDGVEDGIPVVRPIDLTGTFVSTNNLKKTTEKISSSYSRTILTGKELLVCVRGTTGVCSLVTDELKGCNVTRGITPLLFNDNTDRWFMYYQFQMPQIKCIIADYTKGITLKQINMADFRKIPVILPPLPLQQLFAQRIELIEKQKAEIQSTIADLETLLASRMQYWFD